MNISYLPLTRWELETKWDPVPALKNLPNSEALLLFCPFQKDIDTLSKDRQTRKSVFITWYAKHDEETNTDLEIQERDHLTVQAGKLD